MRSPSFLLPALFAGICLASAAIPRVAVSAPVNNVGDGEYENLSLEELMNIPVNAASGFEQLTDEAPSYVTVITAADIEAFGYRTLAEAVSSAAGMYVGYDRTYHSVGVRGFNRPGDYNTRTLVLINGVRVNDPLYGMGRIGGDFPLDVDLIDRIEIVRGPSSSLYGSNAFFAVINVITREARDIAPVEAAASAGSYDAYAGRFSFGRDFGEAGSVLLSGSLFDSDGDDLYFPAFDDPATNDGVAEDLDGENVGSLFFRGRRGNWTLQMAHLDRSKQRPTASFGTLFNDPASEDCDVESLADLIWTGSLGANWDGLFRAGYQRYEYRGYWPYDYAEEPDPLDRWVDEDNAISETFDGEARVTTKSLSRNVVTVGLEIRDAFRIDQTLTAQGEDVLESREDQSDLGVFAQDEIRLAGWALLNAGLRYDRVEPYGNEAFSPRAALIMSPASATTIKLVYGEAFRAPNAYERFYDDDGAATKSNPALEPETIRTYEIVWEQDIAEAYRINAALYHYDVDELVTQVLDPDDELLVFQNIESAEAQGFEVEGIADLPADIMLRGSYAFCRAKDTSTGDRLSNSPEHMAKLNLFAPVVSRWLAAAVEVQYLSERITVHGTKTNGYAVVNATLLSRHIAGKLDLSLSAYNLFDEIYAHPVGEEIEGGVVEQDGRVFRLKMTFRF